MADSPNLPGSHAWPPKSPGEWRDFYGFLRDLVRFVRQTSGNSDSLTALEARITALENAPEPDLGQISGDMSVFVQGLLGQVVQLRLVNDVTSPGDTYYYGTNADGTKGWHAVSDTLAEGSGIDLTVDADGVTEIAHGDTSSVANFSSDSSGGTVIQDLGVTFDGFGHVQTITAATVDLDLRYQPLDATLTALSGQNWVLNALPIGSGADTVSQVAFAANTFPARASTGNLVAKPISDDALAFLAAANDAAMRTELGLGTMAVETAANYLLLAGGTMTGNITVGTDIWRITAATTDGSDTRSIIIDSGVNLDPNRGAYIRVNGNEASSNPGSVLCISGNGADIIFSGGKLRPNADNLYDFGATGNRWAAGYIVQMNLSGAEYHTGIQSVSLTANTDNQTINSTTRVLRLGSNGAYNLTGLTGGASGRRLTLLNTSAFTIALTHDVTSTAANRFFCPNNASVLVRQNGSVEAIYDATSSRWRVIGA